MWEQKMGKGGKKMRNTGELKGYAEYLFRRELAEGTIDIYVREARKLIVFLGKRQISKEEMIRYKGDLVKRKIRTSTRNLYIVAANSYIKYLGYESCGVRTERIQKRHSLSNILSGEDAGKMLSTARREGREKYYYIMRTLCLTGMRIGELPFLTVEKLAKGRFTVENKGKARDIYLPDRLVEELYGYCGTMGIMSGTVFLGKKGKPIHRTSVYKAFIKLAAESGVPCEKAHPHSFRHLFAMTYMKQYGNLTELADILGHSSLETTRIYTLTTAEEKRRRLNELEF